MTFTNKLMAVLVCSTLGAATTPAAQADVTLKMRTTVNSPMLDKAKANMSAAQAAAVATSVDSMTRSTLYLSGKRYRMDNAMMSMIMDAGTKQMTMLNPAKHTYYTTPMDQNAMKSMMGGALGPMPGGNTPAYKLTDTGKTTKFLGYNCEHYIMDMTMNMKQTGSITMHADILSATDLPGLDATAYQEMQSQMGFPGVMMKGVPLLTTSQMSGGIFGTMTTNSEATDISTAPIPASVFDIPSDYQQTTMPSMFGAPSQAPIQVPGQ